MVYIDFYISFTMFADYRDLITCCSLSATLTPKCSCVAVYVIECSCILILLILPAICTPYPYTLHSSSESHMCAWCCVGHRATCDAPLFSATAHVHEGLLLPTLRSLANHL